MPTAEEIYSQAAAAGARPDPLLTVSEWADGYRTLSQRASAEPGPWRTDRTPYLREIMDCLSPSSSVETVVLMKGAQVGGTECGNNWIGYVVHQAPGPMLAVQPTVDMAKRNSKQRIDPLIDESDVLRELVSDPRSRDSGNTILAKEFPGGILVMTGDSDQRYYWVPCPHCQEYQTLKFAHVRWPEGEPELALYICEHCGREIENHQKHWMLARGEWRAVAPGPGKAAGFHLSSLYSPVGWFSWADAAQMFTEAQKNPALLQVFINTVLGETWALQGEAPEWQRLYDRREDYRIGTVPKGGLFLTAGVDVQKDRIELEIVAWGRGKESWSVDYLVLEGQTAEAAVWHRLTGALNAHYPTESGGALPIVKFAIDSGYATQEVYAWARRYGGERAIVIKGDSRAAAPVSQPSPIDVGPQGQRVRLGVKVWPINGSMIKEELYRWLRLDRPTEESGSPYPSGYCHFPKYS
jgi:phage terminase large subunit GpA-like protein